MPAPQAQLQTPVFATVNNFCLLSGIGRTKLYEALKEGYIPARKIGNRTLISVAAGLAWIESQPAYRPN